MAVEVLSAKKTEEFFKIISDYDGIKNPSAKFFCELFAATKNGPPKYHPNDLIEIGVEQSKYVAPKTITTIGIYLLNMILLDDLGIFGYVNSEFTNKTWDKLDEYLADAILEKDVTIEQVSVFIDRTQYLFGGPLAHIINPSITPTIIQLPASAAALKKKLLAEHKEELDNENPQVAAMIERAVTDEALRVMRESDDPALSLFDSGVVDPYNNYKTMFVMKGAVADNTGLSPTGYKVITSDYDNGISKSDLPKIADTVVTSSYNSGVATQDSGYEGKKLNILFQNIRLQAKGSDCGTTRTLNTVITSKHLYRYIMVNKKPVLLTPENLDTYKGKVAQLRSPLHCHAPDPYYCNICFGDRQYRLGNTNIGLNMFTVSGSTLNASLKTKHDATVKSHTVSSEDILRYTVQK